MQRINEGLPPLKPSARCMSRFEFIHPIVFYAPIVTYALGLMIRHRSITLPMLANPNIFAGGAVGECKSDVLNLAGCYARKFIAPYTMVTKTTDEETISAAKTALKQAKLAYPIVAKPETGLRGAGVRPILNPQSLNTYISQFPAGRDIMLQKKIEHAAEAGVFYIRYPHETRGEIFSLTLKYTASLIGDGRRSVRSLIMDCPRCSKMQHIYMRTHAQLLDTVLPLGEEMALNFAGNHARGAIFRDGAAHITPEMIDAFDAIAQDFPNLHFARFDVRFPTLDAFKAGKDFSILEVNGVGAEATHIWDCQMRAKDAYRVLANQWRHAFAIGAANKAQHHKLPSLRKLLRIWIDELARADDYPLAY